MVLVHSGSEVGVNAGGCSATRVAARCACRSRRIGPPASTSATPATAAKQDRQPIPPERRQSTMPRCPRLASCETRRAMRVGPALAERRMRGRRSARVPASLNESPEMSPKPGRSGPLSGDRARSVRARGAMGGRGGGPGRGGAGGQLVVPPGNSLTDSRAKIEHGKDAGFRRSSATSESEDAARRRFAAANRQRICGRCH